MYVVDNNSLPGSYLYIAFVVKLDSHDGDVWIAGSGASYQMTQDGTVLL